MKNKIRAFLLNKYVDGFLIGLILLNFVVFIFQTDANFYASCKILIDKFEFISVVIFTIEYFLRVITLNSFKDLFKFMMIIDFFAIFPYYLSLVTVNTTFLRILRVFRIFRLAKLARYTTAFLRIKKALFKHKDELILTTGIFIIGLTLAAITIYFAESKTGNTAFSSIPNSYWWAVLTFTNVGYGDTYPETTFGKFIGAFTAIMGVGIHALLIGVIGAAFIDATKKDE